MDKYIKLSQKSFATLSSILSGKVQSSIPLQRSEGIEGMLKDLIAIPSITGDYEQLHLAVDYADHVLSECGMRVKRLEWNGVESLVATTQNTKTPKVMLLAHLDVVPGSKEMYTLKEQDGKYFGRGTFDMKFAVAAFLQIVEDIQNNLHEYDLGIMLVTDEEIGGFNGACKLAQEGYLPKAMVVPDGGDDWNLETFCKGIWFVTLTTEGKEAHGSRPWEGDNANQRLMDAIYEIKQAVPYTHKKGSTVNIGVFSGGDVVNKVAAAASAELDFRFGSIKDDKRIRDEVKRICKKYKISLTGDTYAPPQFNDFSNPALQSFVQSIKTITGITAKETMSYAGTDARFFGDAGVPCIIIRPPGGNLHGPMEWINKKGFLQFKDVLRDYIDKNAKVDTA